MKSLFYSFIEQYKNNKLLFISFAVALLFIANFGTLVLRDQSSFIGIAENQDAQISFDHPVEISKVYVSPGQKVMAGTLLVKVNHPEIELKISQLKNLVKQKVSELQMSAAFLGRKSFDFSNLDHSDPLYLELKTITDELRYYQSRASRHNVYSSTAGVVEKTDFKAQTLIPAFTAILNVSSVRPKLVKVFLPETKHQEFEIGQQVIVSSLATGKEVFGVVSGLGSKLIELPERVQVSQMVRQWGREVVVKIPATNSLLVGEKVKVTKPFLNIGIDNAHASFTEVSEQGTPLSPIDLISDDNRAEISGAIHIASSNQVLLLSDEKIRDTILPLFKVKTGDNYLQPVEIRSKLKLPHFNDLESMTQDSEGNLLIMGSLSKNSNGIMRAERNYLIKASLKNNYVEITDFVNLRSRVLSAIKNIKEWPLEFQFKLTDKLNIEGIFIADDTLYVAINRPLINGKALILKIEKINHIFTDSPLKAKVWKTIEFPVNQPLGITDIVVGEDSQIYISCSDKTSKKQIQSFQ